MHTTSATASATRNRPGAEARLAHGRRAGGHEQGREDGERDEVAECEIDDPREPVDERVPDGEDAVDTARGESGDDHLDDQAHGRTLSLQASEAAER